ncbi:hypothetical protein CUT44_20140 [Streptomyces carminius]|uniref:NlpC/P60 family protein n=1 Tax=Streptomyces carminius TaxID=2665496 RepID=A0A2M8LVX6_9ACTN|nr:hypothetical protein [Streptomyces carminius]PJE96102.1 hypothetical protein CUT44_20140 [Streptomyces carminius]
MSHLRGRPARAAAVAVLTAAAAVVLSPATDARGESVADLLLRLREAYRQAETAGTAHRAAVRELAGQRAETVRLQRRLADTRVELDAARDTAGLVARRQYQGAGTFPPALRLLLGRDPAEVRAVFEHGRLLERMAARQRTAAGRLDSAEGELDRRATLARRALDRERMLAGREERRRDAAERRLAEVQRLLAGLGDEELAALRRSQEQAEQARAGQARAGQARAGQAQAEQARPYPGGG